MVDFFQHSVVCYRRIIVRDGSIEVVAHFEQRSLAIALARVPDSILQVPAGYFEADDKFLSISFQPNSRFIQIESHAFSESSL
jgi:hypothetical protein